MRLVENGCSDSNTNRHSRSWWLGVGDGRSIFGRSSSRTGNVSPDEHKLRIKH